MTQAAERQSIERTRQPWVSVATRDAIRHFAWGVGDNNPLWLDPDHARASRWGGLVAPPCLLYAVDETSVAPGHPTSRRVYKSVDWTFYDWVHEGSALELAAWQTGEQVVDGEVEQLGRVDFDVAGKGLVATAQTICLRTTKPMLSTDDRPELRYSGEQLNMIERTILDEARCGTTSRTFEDVELGAALGPLIKGPLSIMDVVAWCSATSGVVDDDQGYSEGGLHAESATGPEQVSWIAQLLTDWMGDDGFLHRLNLELDETPPLGATTTITGRVISLDIEAGRPTARIELLAENQHGAATARGRADIILPSTEYGPVQLPIAPQ